MGVLLYPRTDCITPPLSRENCASTRYRRYIESVGVTSRQRSVTSGQNAKSPVNNRVERRKVSIIGELKIKGLTWPRGSFFRTARLSYAFAGRRPELTVTTLADNG